MLGMSSNCVVSMYVESRPCINGGHVALAHGKHRVRRKRV
jgi:hypothetical protein